MILDPKIALEKGILEDPEGKGKLGFIGYDLSVRRINKIEGSDQFQNFLLSERTLIRPETYSSVPAFPLDHKSSVFSLSPGVYSVVFDQHLILPTNVYAQIKTRSSLLRMGALCEGGEYEPGFHCENMGCVMIVFTEGVNIEVGSRVGQLVVYELSYSTSGYDGQWQGENDLK